MTSVSAEILWGEYCRRIITVEYVTDVNDMEGNRQAILDAETARENAEQM